MDTNNHYFNALESLRGVAALTVVLYHLTGEWGGYLAVDFFLMLSGFILTHTTHFTAHPPGTKDFILKRLFRLYPLHIFTLATVTIVHFILNRAPPEIPDGLWFTLAQQFTLTNNIGLNEHGMEVWNFPSWSISVEFWVCVFFILFLRRYTPTLILICLCVVPLTLIYLMTGHMNVHYHNYFGFVNAGLLRGLASFSLGIILCRLYHRRDDSPALSHLRRYATLYESLALLACVCLFVLPDGKKTAMDFWAIPVFFFTVLVFSFESGKIAKKITEIKYLGTISYSIYLNQITIIMAMNAVFRAFAWPPTHQILVTIVILVLYSHLTYRYIESPAKRFLNQRFIQSKHD